MRNDALPQNWGTWFVNANDGTNEGIRHRNRPFMSIQLHPEATLGPVDTAHLFKIGLSSYSEPSLFVFLQVSIFVLFSSFFIHGPIFFFTLPSVESSLADGLIYRTGQTMLS